MGEGEENPVQSTEISPMIVFYLISFIENINPSAGFRYSAHLKGHGSFCGPWGNCSLFPFLRKDFKPRGDIASFISMVAVAEGYVEQNKL